MTHSGDRNRTRKLIVRGFGWWLCVGVWTLALLTTYPIEVGDAITPLSLQFPAAKCLHVSAYAFLTFFLSRIPLRRWRWLFLAFLSLHAAGTEFFQQFVPGRHGKGLDVLIDHIGILSGVALTWRHWLPRRDPSCLRPGVSPPRDAASVRSLTFSSRPSSPPRSAPAPAESGDRSTTRSPQRSE